MLAGGLLAAGVLTACGGDGDDPDGLAGGSGSAMTGAARSGRDLADEKGCTSCHRNDGSGTGPSWEGIWGTEATLTDGTVVEVDRTYVERAITDPRSEVLDGYQPIMPEVPLSADEVDALASYIEALGRRPG